MYNKLDIVSEIKQIITMHHYFILANIEEKLAERGVGEIETEKFIASITGATNCSRDLLSQHSTFLANNLLH